MNSSNPFAPIQASDVRARRNMTLKRKFDKLDRFFDIPLDDMENRELERKDIIKEFQVIDTIGLISLVTRTNLTDPEDRSKVEQILEDNWGVDYFLLFFVTLKLEQQALLARLTKFFEDQFVTLAPATTAHILDRSFLNENMEKFEALPKRYRDFLMDIFLKVTVPGHYDSHMDNDLPGPSTSSEPQLKRKKKDLTPKPGKEIRLDSTELPQIVKEIRRIEVLDDVSRKDAYDTLMKDCEASPFEKALLRTLFTKNEDLLSNTLDPAKTGSVNEFFLLWILTHQTYGAAIEEWLQKYLKKQLRQYFNKQFAYMVPESSSLCFINRIYYVENRLAIEALSEEGQKFVQNCFLTAPTRGHEGHVEDYKYAEGFVLNAPSNFPPKLSENQPKPVKKEITGWDFNNS